MPAATTTTIFPSSGDIATNNGDGSHADEISFTDWVRTTVGIGGVVQGLVPREDTTQVDKVILSAGNILVAGVLIEFPDETFVTVDTNTLDQHWFLRLLRDTQGHVSGAEFDRIIAGASWPPLASDDEVSLFSASTAAGSACMLAT